MSMTPGAEGSRYAAPLPPEARRTLQALTLLLAILMLLATLPLASAVGLAGLTAQWQRDLGGEWTVILPAEPDPDIAEAERTALLTLGQSTPGIASIRRIVAQGLFHNDPEPALSPRIFAIRLDASGGLSSDAFLAALQERLGREAHLDDHRRWLNDAENTALVVAVTAGLIGLGLAVAAAIASGLSVTLRLRMHEEATRIMRLLGASDAQISRRITGDAARMGGRAALAAMLVAGLATMSVLLVTGFPASLWLLVLTPTAVVPAALAVFVWATAKWASGRYLARLP